MVGEDIHIFHSEFTIDDTNSHITIVYCKRLVNYKDVAIEDICVNHRISGNARIESALGMRYQIAIEVYALIDGILCWSGKARNNTTIDVYQLQRFLIKSGEYFEGGHKRVKIKDKR